MADTGAVVGGRLKLKGVAVKKKKKKSRNKKDAATKEPETIAAAAPTADKKRKGDPQEKDATKRIDSENDSVILDRPDELKNKLLSIMTPAERKFHEQQQALVIRIFPSIF
eukprot:TRINITY_DN4196_c0_g1_i1.p1 TRINITY_DN4196_c0_g1~~TRINITY_DN4196_c0_g1_i1.p1  ORF type:complete len:129 (+),score=5.74 TRINITY_DN4196_c0_g1_i1:57-389(+)